MLDKDTGETANHKGVIILVGAPGSGKGTQAQLISEKFGIPSIKIGDILRTIANQNTQLGRDVRNRLADGHLMENNILAKVINRYTVTEEFNAGFVIEGYPRNLKQFLWFDEWLRQKEMKFLAVFLSIPAHVAEKRLLGRRGCNNCGATDNIAWNSTRPNSNQCSSCGEQLTSRDDDNVETIRKRFTTYDHSTIPLIAFFRDNNKLIEIDGNNKVNIVFDEIIKGCERLFINS